MFERIYFIRRKCVSERKGKREGGGNARDGGRLHITTRISASSKMLLLGSHAHTFVLARGGRGLLPSPSCFVFFIQFSRALFANDNKHLHLKKRNTIIKYKKCEKSLKGTRK